MTASLIWLCALDVLRPAELARSVCAWGLLVWIAVFDARYFVIPTSLVLALGAGGLIDAGVGGWASVLSGGLACAISYVMLRALELGFRVLRGVDGLGRGDANLLAAGAPWIGLEGLGGALVFAVLSALIAVLVMRARGARLTRGVAIPFGPHLAVGVWLVRVFGPLDLAPIL